MSQTVTPCFQGTDRLLKSFLIGLADTHNLTHGTHLSPQLILYALELFKGPACKFDHHIIAVRHIFIQSTVLAAGNLL